MMFCSINSGVVCSQWKFQKDDALNHQKNEVWNVAASITSQRGRDYQTQIINDKITL